jgi:hypothetical protein
VNRKAIRRDLRLLVLAWMRARIAPRLAASSSRLYFS